MSVFKLVRVGILAGIAFVLMLIEFPLPFFPDFLKYDTSEIPVLLGTFSMGPWVGVLIQLIKNMLYLFLSGRGNPIGVMGNFLAGSIMVLPAGYVYPAIQHQKRRHPCSGCREYGHGDRHDSVKFIYSFPTVWH
ncbi:MAG: ECF transporter S component [bacterium]